MRAIKALLLHFIELLGGFYIMRLLKKNEPVVLMYHRIIDHPFVSGLTPEEFERQIIYINKHFKVVPLQQLINDLVQGSLQPYSLALTFDDGHYDFYANAWPILKKYNLPASIYVTTGFVDGTTWLWPDLLKHILINSRAPQLNLECANASHLGTISTQKDDLYKSWHKLGDYCLTLKTDERNQFLRALANQAHVDLPTSPQPPFHSITWTQLNEMARDGLDVGSHTVSHPILSSLNQEDLNYELGISAEAIRQHLGILPMGICYPNGRPEDINQGVIQIAQNLGYTYGLMGRNATIKKTSLFKIGRLAANKNFFYFKWTLARRKEDINSSYIQ
ncbi:polysaccharide deacetylase family protein [Cellvibrio sp.]|uniref:polysaccharide deacetylase family protein n=1 Tax=Cellvibrio sp. TaxID=1965322 RepID=UPI0039648986